MRWTARNTFGWVILLCLAGALGIPAFAGAAPAPTSITVTGAGKGANAYRALAAVAEVVNKNSKWLRATNRESGGFVEGTRLVARNRVQIAMSSGPFVDFWQRKFNPFERDTGSRDTLRGVGPSGDAIMQIAVLKDSDIKTFADLKGKRVSLGPKGSNSAWMIEYALKGAGLWDSVRKDSMNWSDAATYMVDRKIDAFGIPNPLGAPAVLQASYSAPIRILNLPDSVIQKFIDYSKGYYKKTYTTNLYKGMENEPFTTVVYMSMLVANSQVPNDVVYEATRHTYDPKNAEMMVNIAIGWKSGLEQAKDPEFLRIMQMTGMKIHPGAARYWKERGLKAD